MLKTWIEEVRPHCGPIMILLIATYAVYGRILGHEFIFNWDDNLYVAANSSIQGFSRQHLKDVFTSTYAGNYAPLQMLSYMLDYALWGLHAGGFLFTNILIHAVSGLIFYWLLMRWYGERLLAFVASALFLLHPVQVESVAWVSQRKNLLALMFFLMAWAGYCLYRDAGKGKGHLFLLSALGAFIAALLAKSVVIVLPVVLILYDFCFSEDGYHVRIKDKIPFIIASGIVAVVTVYTHGSDLGGGRVDYHGGSPLATLYTMLPVFCQYLGQLIWPVGLSALYVPTIHQSFNVVVGAAALVLAGLAYAGWCLGVRDRRLGFWCLFIFLGVLPVSQIVPLVTLMNDRYLYLPMLGVATLAGTAAVQLHTWLGTKRPNLVCVLIAVPLLLLSIGTYQRAGVWRDPLTFWSDTVAKSPAASYAWSSLAEVYFRSLRVEESIAAYEQSLTLDPQNKMAIAALGPLYTELGELDKGYEMLQRFLVLQPMSVKGWTYLGNNYLSRGYYSDAERMYKHALSLEPSAMNIVMLLGNLAIIQGHFDHAREYFWHIEIQSNKDPDAAYHLACVESLAGRIDSGLAWIEKALQRGYRDLERLNNNEELVALRATARYGILLQRYFPETKQGN